MWDIHSTTELLKNMSAAAEPDELLRLFIEHVRHSTHDRRGAGALMIKTQHYMCTYIQARKGL